MLQNIVLDFLFISLKEKSLGTMKSSDWSGVMVCQGNLESAAVMLAGESY